MTTTPKKLLEGGRMYDPTDSTPFEDLDPPDFLPMREPLPPRIPDICPDEPTHGSSCHCDDCEEERNR